MSAQDIDRDEVLRRQFGRLEREATPGRDLWPQIRRQIGPPLQGVRRSAAWFGHSTRWALAAGFVGLAVGIVVTMAVIREHGGVVRPQLAVDSLLPVSVYAFAPPKAEAARLALRREVAANLARLSPPTRARVQRNLLEIERALADIQGALARNPSDGLLQELLMTTYQNEVDTLSSVVLLTRDANSQVSI